MVTFPFGIQLRAVRLSRKSLTLLVLCALIPLGCFGLWTSVRNHFIPKRFGATISGKVYRSGQLSPWLVEEVLRDNQIRVIVDLQGFDPHDRTREAESRAAKKLGIDQHYCGLKGNGTGDIAQYAYAITLIDQAVRQGQPVLVHCAAGSQRTGGVIAMYRMLVLGDAPYEVYDEMRRFGWKRKTPDVMEEFLNAHMSVLVEELVSNGTLKKFPAELPHLGAPY